MGTKTYLLAADVGTSACKAAIFDTRGNAVAGASCEYPVLYPKPGYAQQDPQQWWQAVCSAIRQCLQQSGIAPAQIAGVGVDGQSWSCIPVDENGEVLYDTPIWMDTRSDAVCREVMSRDGAQRLFAVSGNPFAPSYTTPKILWFKRNMPQVYQKARFFMQSNSFIVQRLTGVYTQDVSQGYGLHVFDIAKKQYDEELCRFLEIDRSKLPDIFPCDAVVGQVTAQAAALCGLQQGTPVVAGGLDAACGTLGAGVYLDGQTQEQGGQAGGMSICLSAPESDPALILSAHVVPGKWLLQGGTVGGGGSLRWLAKELGQPELLQAQSGGKNQFALLDELAAQVAPGSDGAVFLPYLAGERSPIWDPDACGVFFGLNYSHTRAHFFRALLEGAAFALRHNLEAAQKAGVDAKVLHAMGGAANSALWTQIKADVTGKPIRVPGSDNATVLGAAMLAGVATGVYPDYAGAVEQTVRFHKSYEPNPANRAAYDHNYETYLALYPSLREVMHNAAGHKA